MDVYESAKLARRLMDDHGLSEWDLKYGNARNVFGSCSVHTKTIRLSRVLVALNTEAEVLDAILHEVAHALTPGHGHDGVWKAKAQEIGCNGQRVHDAVTPPKLYVGTCPNCKGIVKKNRRSRAACYSCCMEYNAGRYTVLFLRVWTKNLDNVVVGR